jgi:type VI protein secretion system component Hcp
MKTKLFLFALVSLLLVSPVFAAYDMYLAINGVVGSLTDASHKDWAPVTGLKEMPIKSGSAGTLTVVRLLDSNSPAIYKECVSGSPRPGGQLDICKDGVLIFKIRMQNVAITQVNARTAKDDNTPVEDVSLSTSQVQWEAIGADGKPVGTPAGWDSSKNRVI